MAKAENHDLDLPPGTVMWERDFERLKEESAQRKAQQKIEDEKAKREAEVQYEAAIPLKNKMPYSEAIAQDICERISAGELLINICDDIDMPTLRRCNQWLKMNPEFGIVFKDSINDRLSIFEEQVIQIADDVANDFKEVVRNGRTVKVVDAEVIARAKLRVEVRFKHLKAGRPNKWGDSTTLITKSEDDASELSNEELERRLNDLEVKDKIIKSV